MAALAIGPPRHGGYNSGVARGRGKDRGRVNGYWDFLGRDGRSLHRRWRLFSVGGTSTLVGNLIGLAVYDAVAEGVRLEQEASGKSLGSAAAGSVMLVLTTSQR